MASSHSDLIREFQEILDRVSQPDKKEWWERYLKQVIQFRGVGIPVIKTKLRRWFDEKKLSQWESIDLLELAMEFIGEVHAEDKLTGVLILEEYLINDTLLESNVFVRRFETMFADEDIFDWNTCDWFCIRVLGPLIVRDGQSVAIKISAWSDSQYLWQARASLVGFVYLVKNTEFHSLILDSSSTLIKREERFAKTAVGWVLRELASVDERKVLDFIDSHIEWFSRESLRNATKHLNLEVKNQILNRK